MRIHSIRWNFLRLFSGPLQDSSQLFRLFIGFSLRCNLSSSLLHAWIFPFSKLRFHVSFRGAWKFKLNSVKYFPVDPFFNKGINDLNVVQKLIEEGDVLHLSYV